MLKSKGFLNHLTVFGLALKVLEIIIRVNKLEKDVNDMAATKNDVLTAIQSFTTVVFNQLQKIETDLAAYQDKVANDAANADPQALQDILDAVTASKEKLSGATAEIDSKIPERVLDNPAPADNGTATTGGDTSTATPGADSGSTASGEGTTSGSTGVDANTGDAVAQ